MTMPRITLAEDTGADWDTFRMLLRLLGDDLLYKWILDDGTTVLGTYAGIYHQGEILVSLYNDDDSLVFEGMKVLNEGGITARVPFDRLTTLEVQ